MTVVQVQCVVLVVLALAGASSFALWQESWAAGFWMLTVLLFVYLLV